MVEIFAPNEKELVKKKIQQAWIIFSCVVAVLLFVNFAIIFWMRPVTFWGAIVLNVLFTTLLGGYILYFFTLSFRARHKYYKLLKNMSLGEKEKGAGSFVDFEREIITRDGVEFYCMNIDEGRVKTKDENTLRRLLVESNHNLPQFEIGQKINFVVQGGVILEYELVN